MAAFLDRALAYAGYRVAVAEDGERALVQAEEHAPDLVVLDVMLPGIDGLEVARRLRSSSGAPILMLTAREGLDDRIEGLDAGADDYLSKPFALQELLARLRALLRGRALAVAESRRGLLTYADVTLDQDAREASRNGRRLTVRNKEFELLAYFLHHPERVLEPRAILEAVWGYPYLGDANLVHVTLRRLRQVLMILLDNAVKHAPADGRVTIVAERASHADASSAGGDAGTRVGIHVSDDGPGVAPTDRERIFERFYRAPGTRSGEGTGLGLAIARWIVEEHQGRIALASPPGAGATFTVWLPAIPAPASELQKPLTPVPPLRAGEGGRGGEVAPSGEVHHGGGHTA